jgi:galactokinase/mevalonate kinase-like predicted kinase
MARSPMRISLGGGTELEAYYATCGGGFLLLYSL